MSWGFPSVPRSIYGIKKLLRMYFAHMQQKYGMEIVCLAIWYGDSVYYQFGMEMEHGDCVLV